jgi:hypothetical protein
MKRLTCLLLIGLLSSLGWGLEPQTPLPAATPLGTDDEAGETTISVWMEKKLVHSQAILRGLAMGDLRDVQYNASRLKVLNRVEGFVRRKNPDYRSHLNTFSRVIVEIERQAERENIEGATLAFNQLTVSCVQCHKSLRSSVDESEHSESVLQDQ